MAAEERWYFTKQQLSDTPNRKCGIDPDKELSYRQQAANFIQDMGQRLQVNQLCINTAIVYMHRFYMFHTFTKFHRNAISTCALFLAAKVEEQPRKLEHVIKVAHLCLHREAPPLDAKSEAYLEQAQELVINENIMLQTLGFDVAIDHPHTHVVKCCQLVRGTSTSIHQHHVSKDLAQTSYFMATNSLHLTTMCLQYKPTVVACVCIHLACKWGSWEIPRSREGRKWFYYVDKTVTEELLEELTSEFLAILDRCPSRLKRRMMSANTAGTNEFSDMNCSEALAQSALPLGKAGASSMSLTLSTPISTLKVEKSSSEKYHERERDRASASTSKSGLKTTPSATVSSAEKNGTPGGGAPERKDRVKKEHISSSSSSAGGLTVAPPQLTSVLASSSDLTQQAVPTVATSPVTSISGKSDLVKIANCMDNVQLSLPSGDTSLSTPKKSRADGTSRTMTPKEYHEYKERSKREKEKMKQPQVALAEHGRIQAAKQAGSSAAKPFMKATVDGIHNGTDDTSSSLAQGFGQIAVNARQSPEHEGRDANSGVAKMTSVNVAGDSGGSSHPALAGFPIVPILTPSPPTTKDGDPFSMDEEMPVFASPSVFLVPVAPAEVEPVQPAAVPVVEPIKVGVVKSESRKQRKDEPPAFIDTNNEFKPQLNSTFPTSEHRKREKVNSKMSDVISDVPQIGIDSHQTSRRPHNVKNSSDKPSKHHRVKKSQSASLPIKSECHGDDGGFLPQQDFNVLVPDHVNVNPTVVSAKLSEINTEISRITNATHSQSTTSSTEIIQQPGLNFISAPIAPEPANETKINRNFQETRHSSQQKGNTLPLPIPEEIINTNEKHVADSEVPPVQTVKTENETKHSKRSVQSSSSSSSTKHKEKRKKHDRKEKPKEHSRDKGEEKLVPKFKLTIPKDALSTTSASNTTKSEASGNGESTNHKPKDESLVVKIKLNTAAVGGKSSKNGSLPEVVPSSQQQQQQQPPPPPPVSETLTVKERTGLKIKLTKNHSSKESYSIGNDEAKSKDKPKSTKESRKRSRSSASPKNKEPTHNVVPDVVQPPPAKTLKTISAKSPKKVSVNNNNQTIAAPSPAVSSNPPAQASIAAPVTVEPPLKIPASRKVKSEQPIVLPPQLQQQMQQQQMTPTMMTNNNNIDYNRRSQVHEREPQRSRGGKRGRGNMRMPPGPPPGPPLSLPLPPQQQMMFQGMMPMYDRGGGASDGYAQFYNFGQNNYFGHPMFQDENPMFFSQCGPGPPHAPIMRHPPPHMAFPQSIHQQSRRGGGQHYIRPPVLPQRPGSGPPLPSVPPPANPPLPPDM